MVSIDHVLYTIHLFDYVVAFCFTLSMFSAMLLLWRLWCLCFIFYVLQCTSLPMEEYITLGIIEYSCTISINWFVFPWRFLLFLLLRYDSEPCMYVMALNARTLFLSTNHIKNSQSFLNPDIRCDSGYSSRRILRSVRDSSSSVVCT